MVIASLGQLSIEVTPSAENPEILHIDMGCANRRDVLSMKTNKDETVDQFAKRIQSMLRALINCETREPLEPAKEIKEAKKGKSWPEQKSEMKAKAPSV